MIEKITAVIVLLIAAETTYLVFRKSKKSYKPKRPILVDTSVLIDGRIIQIAQAGFLTNQLWIPKSVIGELQLLADGSDSDKRSRARHGLDVVAELQAIKGVEVVVFEDKSKGNGVDSQLLKLAQKHKGSICTIDYNLAKVAAVDNIKVLNINDLAMSLRMAFLPGETAQIHLIQKGHDNHQAVAYLDDGTMVVVENASTKIGQKVEVEFTRSLQTAAGRMMFAKIVGAANKNQSGPKRNLNNRAGKK